MQVLPTILLAPISGVLADRFHKIKLMSLSALIRAPFALLPLVAISTGDVLWLYISTFLIAIGNAFYRPVRFAAIPDLVQRKNLLHVNGMEQHLIGYTLVFGSLTGGLFAFWIGTNVLFLLNGSCLLIAAAVLKPILSVKTREQKLVTTVHLPVLQTMKWFVGIRVLQVFFIMMLLMPLANGIDNIVMNMIALDEFDRGELGVGLMYAALGLGFVLSSKMTLI